MSIQEIKDFAINNKIDATLLLLAADSLLKDILISKLNEHGGCCNFLMEDNEGNSIEVPYVICTCFDPVCELRVASVFFDENGDIAIHCVDDENKDEYTLGLTDIAYGQSMFIVQEM